MPHRGSSSSKFTCGVLQCCGPVTVTCKLNVCVCIHVCVHVCVCSTRDQGWYLSSSVPAMQAL